MLTRRSFAALNPFSILGLMLRGIPAADDTPPNFYLVKSVGQEFGPYYEQHIKPRCDEYEMLRIDALTRMRWRCWVALLVTGFVIFSSVFFRDWFFDHMKSSDAVGFLFQVALVVMALVWGWAVYPGISYQKDVKSNIYPAVFRFFGDHYQFDHSGMGMTITSLEPSGLIGNYNQTHQEDYVDGNHKGVALELLETRLTRVEGSGKNRRTILVFGGICVRLSMNKPFKGRTMVKKDASFLLNWAQDKRGLEKVTLEDPVFEKEFEVFSNDQVEARYLLSTSMMERMLKLRELIDGSGIQASFYDNRLLLMVSTHKNWFEGGSVFSPADFVNDINIILEQMATIFDVIEALKLHEVTHL